MTYRVTIIIEYQDSSTFLEVEIIAHDDDQIESGVAKIFAEIETLGVQMRVKEIYAIH